MIQNTSLRNTLRYSSPFIGPALIYAGGMFMVTENTSPENIRSYNQSVMECANVLGPKAIDAATIPDKCQTFDDRIDSTTVITTRTTGGNHNSQSSDSQTQTIYQLPSGVQFAKDQIFTEEERVSEERREKLIIYAAAGASALFALGTVVKLARTRKTPAA